MDSYAIYPKQFNNSNFKLQSNTCFVIMPFANEYSNTYTIIESVANSMKITCKRADKLSTTSEPIINKICTQITQAYFIIVDITDLNPNVFYELGIAHVLRDANKVLIIKENQTKCPSDINHINYYSYDKSNLQELKDTINKFFSENSILEDLHDILNFLDLLPIDSTLSNIFLLDLSNSIGNDTTVLIKTLNNKHNELLDNENINLLEHLVVRLEKINQKDDLYGLYADLITNVILKIYKTVNIQEFVTKLFTDKYKNISTEWISDLSIRILDNSLYFDDSISWIISYLKNSSPASFDTARYRIEIGLIKSKSNLIDPVLIKYLKSENKTLAEHCANLIKERKTYLAAPILLELIESETNPYLVRSCIDASIQIDTRDNLIKIQNILLKREDFIKNNSFLNKHLVYLKKKISLF